MNAPELDEMVDAWHEMRAARRDLNEHGGKERLDYLRTAAHVYAQKQRAWSARMVQEGHR